MAASIDVRSYPDRSWWHRLLPSKRPLHSDGDSETDNNDLLGNLGVLPGEVMEEILGYCDSEALCALTECNTFLARVAGSDRLWKERYRRDFKASQAVIQRIEMNQLLGQNSWMKLYGIKAQANRGSTMQTQTIPQDNYVDAAMDIFVLFICVPLVFLALTLILVTLNLPRFVLLCVRIRLLYRTYKLGGRKRNSTPDSTSYPPVALRPKSLVEMLQFAANETIWQGFFIVAYELGMLLGLMNLGTLLVLLTVYRIPAMVKLSVEIAKRIDTGGNGDRAVAVKQIDPAFYQIYGLGNDIIFAIALLLPLFVTVHRIPSLFRKLRALSYSECFIYGAHYGIIWKEFKSIGRCSRPSTDRSQNNTYGALHDGIDDEAVIDLAAHDDADADDDADDDEPSDFCKFVGQLLCVLTLVVTVPLGLLIMLIGCHRAVCLYYRTKAFFISEDVARNPNETISLMHDPIWHSTNPSESSHHEDDAPNVTKWQRLARFACTFNHLVSVELQGIIVDVSCALTPFFCFVIIHVTLYRQPVTIMLIRDKLRLKPMIPDTIFYYDWEIFAVLFMQGLILPVCDIVTLLFAGIPILVTMHRVPSLVRQLKQHSYKELFSEFLLHQILWEEFRNICGECSD